MIDRTPETASTCREPLTPSWGRPAIAAALPLAIIFLAGACGSTSTTNVGPSPVKCEVSLSGAAAVGPAGGAAAITVSTQPECNWTATSPAPWITRLTPRSGQGPGRIEYEAAANPSSVPRQGDIIVNDIPIQIRQDVTLCTFDVSPAGISAQSAGGARAITVAGTAGCPWTASSSASWIVVTSGANGTGAGTVNVQINGHTGDAPRSGTLSIAGRSVTVSQSAGGTGTCAYAVSPAAHNAPASGGPATIAVTSEPGCAWAASSDVPWITITSSATGAGNGTVAFSVETSSSPARTGRLTIAGQIVTVNQEAGAPTCNYSVQPTFRSMEAAGGDVSASVTVAAGCAWTASSQASWITITGGASGNGDGTVTFSVDANDGPARSGALSIAGHAFTVAQAQGCSYSVQPGNISIGSGGGPGSTSVSTAAGCGWTAGSNVPWVTVTSGSSGNGDGAVGFSVASNNGPERVGTLTVGGQTVTIAQASGCTYSIQPGSASFGAGAASGATSVSTAPGCPWSAASNASWITVTSGASGEGSGTVGFAIAANPSPVRTGTITIATQTFTVTQESGCSYSVLPTALQASMAGGTVSTNVSAGPGCPWSAASNAPWLAVASGTSGSGDGQVVIGVESNVGPARSGTVSVAGQIVTVTQTSGCTFALSPTSATFPILGGTGTINVITAPGCAWTATVAPDANWITVRAGESGSGPGTVTYSVLPLAFGKRSGVIVVGGQPFTVNQPN